MNELFHKVAVRVSLIVGSPRAFVLAVFLIIVWAVSGPLFDFSNTWQLVINTSTTIATLLMVLLVQNTQNRDARAMHLKLDELIKAVHGARNDLVDLEEMTDDQLDELQQQYRTLHEKLTAQRARRAGKQ